MTDAIVPLKEKREKGNQYNGVMYRWLGYRAVDGSKEKELALYEAIQEIVRTERLEAVEGLKRRNEYRRILIEGKPNESIYAQLIDAFDKDVDKVFGL